VTRKLVSPTAVAILIAVVAAFLGGALTPIGPWYEGLNKPPWNPPNWLFGPVWTAIYISLVVAGVRAWRGAERLGGRGLILGLVAVNLVLNVTWSALFFTLQRPDWALIEVVFLWLSNLSLVVLWWRKDRTAGLLTMPYLLWVGFAGYLNFVLVQLNAPFGA